MKTTLLAQKSKMFELLVESAPILFYVADIDMNYLYINPFFAEIHSVDQQKTVGMHISEVIGIDAFNGNLEHYENALAGETIKYDSFFIKADGNPHHYYAVYKPLLEAEVIVGFTGVVVDTTAEKELDRLSKTDTLTRLNNRRKFEYDLEKVLSIEDGKNHGLLILDIDFFKKINDELGHDKGDEALVTLGEVLEDGDILDRVYRIGGEEFAILMSEIDYGADLKDRAEHICKRVASSIILEERKVTVSIGASIIKKPDVRGMLLKRTDVALYSSKSNGRNQVCIA